jgi:hypothetical protein
MTKVELHKIGKEADKTDDTPTYAGSPGNLPAFFLRARHRWHDERTGQHGLE